MTRTFRVDDMLRPGAVMFRVAAGPRLGYGHLVRATRLADALGVRPVVALRGGTAARRAAMALGCELVTGSPSAIHDDWRPVLVVVDDPSGPEARRWCAAAARRHTPVASIHDLGIGLCDADLVIDGSIANNRRVARGRDALVGPRYAVIDPVFAARRRHGDAGRAQPPRVVVALGGGARGTRSRAIASALLGLRPNLDVRVAAGFDIGSPLQVEGDVTWLAPCQSLVDEFAACTMAIVGGGITTYEGCALGVPMVAVATVRAQRPTVRAFAAAGALVDGGALEGDRARLGRQARGIAARAIQLVDAPTTQVRLARAGRALVDGHGAARVAASLRGLVGAAGGRAA